MRYKALSITLLAPAISIAANEEATDTVPQQLKEVVVVAQEAAGPSSSSRIDRAAMQHLQPTSFADILELLPGNISKDPNMSSANAISLRETGTISATGAKTDNEQYAITSLGTQFVIDGAAVNTEANMQAIVGADASDPSAKRSSVNKGVDMRNISTDNIESVEVIRGIPSAEYGNLTSGVVNIKRIKKATPFTFRFKADEHSKLFAASKGVSLGNTSHTINADAGYLDFKNDPRNSLENYKRLTALVMPTFRFYSQSTSIVWNMGIDYAGSFDNTKIDPDLNFNKVDEYKNKYSRTSATSDLSISPYGISWLENITANASASYEIDHLQRRRQVAPQRATLAPSEYEEGEHNAHYLLGEYIANYEIDGKPFTAAIKMKATGKLPINAFKNHYKLGIDWSMSKNYGRGQIYDPAKPLTASWTTRPRTFKEIPALHTLSWFVEDNIDLPIAGNKLEAQAGVRFMALPSLDSKYYLSGRVHADPRINAVWNFPVIDAGKPLRLFLGAGWGKTTRMPTLDYLYPQCRYIDIIQLNYYNTSNPAENSLANVRTYKADIANYDLKAATNEKLEARVGLSWGNNRMTATFFAEHMANGFRYTPVYESYAYKRYNASYIDPQHPSIAALPYEEAKILDGHSLVTNGTKIEKRGIEYTLQTERFRPLATSLIVNGAWFRSTYSNSQAYYSPVNDVVGNQAVSDLYVGVYDTSDGRVNEQFNTNFMLDTQIPRWGLIFTTNIQCMWYVKTRRIKENGIPSSYVSASDGLLRSYLDSDREDIYLQYLVKTYNDDSFKTMKIPTAIYANIKASKQIGRWLRLSAFVNRIIDYLPDYKSNGLTIRRSADAYFGMEAVLTL